MLRSMVGILILAGVAYLLNFAGLMERTIEIGRIFFVFALVIAVIGTSISVISDNSPDEII